MPYLLALLASNRLDESRRIDSLQEPGYLIPTEGSRNNPRYYTLDRQKPDWGCDDSSTRLSYFRSSKCLDRVFFIALEEYLGALALTSCTREDHTHWLASYFLVRSSTVRA